MLNKINDFPPENEIKTIMNVGTFKVAYRKDTCDEYVISESFDNDIFFRGIPEYDVKENHVIIDVGAHIGTFSLLSASKAPKGKVYSIEACYDSFSYLKKNIELNKADNIECFNLALSDSKGTVKLYYDIEAGNWGHSITKQYSEKGEVVQSNTLSNFLSENAIEKCDLLKFNCEGAEFRILMSTPDNILRKCDRMLVLYHLDLVEDYSIPKLISHLKKSGFVISNRNISMNFQRGWLFLERREIFLERLGSNEKSGTCPKIFNLIQKSQLNAALKLIKTSVGNDEIINRLKDFSLIYYEIDNKNISAKYLQDLRNIIRLNLSELKNLGCLYAINEHFEEASGIFFELLKNNSQDIEVLEALANVCIRINAINEARNILEVMAKIDPNNNGIKNQLAEIKTHLASFEGNIKEDALQNQAQDAALKEWEEKIEEETLKISSLATKYLPEGGTLIDVGANVGLFTKQVIKNKRCKVYAFEPVQRYYEYCRKIFQKETNVAVFNYGLSDKDQKLEIWVDRENLGWNTIVDEMHTDNMQNEIIQCVRFDDFVYSNNLERIDVVKIDVEGAEYKVLQGMHETIRKFRPIILLEIAWGAMNNPHWTELTKELEWIFDNGYEKINYSQISMTTDVILEPKRERVSPLITIGIPTRNRLNPLFELIQSIREQTFDSYELIISDDGDQYDIEQEIMQRFPGLRYRYQKGPQKNLPCNRQNILDSASTKYVLMCDDDHVLEKDCVEKLYNTIISSNDIGIVCATWPNEEDEAIDYDLVKNLEDYRLDLNNVVSENVNEENYIEWRNGWRTFASLHSRSLILESQFSGGGCLIYNKSAVESAGGFPKYYSTVSFREDTDMSHRLYLQGWRILINTSAKAFHHQCSNGGCRDIEQVNISRKKDGLLFLEKLNEWRKEAKRELLIENNSLQKNFEKDLLYGSDKTNDLRSIEKAESVLIGLIEHMGDIVACEPVARYLKQLNPNAKLTWVTKYHYQELVSNNPYIDKVVAVDCLKDWILLKNGSKYDEVIDLHVNNRVCTVSGMTLRKTKGNLDVDTENYYNYGSLLGAFCEGAGLPKLNETPKVYISEQIKNKIESLHLPQRFVVFHCCSNELSRDWKIEKWHELADYFIQNYGLTIIEVGDKAVLRNIGAKYKEFYKNYCGQLSILETAEVIKRSSLFVGVDSGPAHLANAVGTYGVVLLGEYRSFKKYMPFSGGYADGTNSTIIYAKNGQANNVEVTEVIESIDKYISSQPDNKIVKSQEVINQNCTKLLAFHLPQYHPIPENNEWWGKGFTEWTNVKKAKPIFDGHYQPHIPAGLGYYDLSVKKDRIAQAEMARQFGIYGFCFYHYWFNGKLLLEKPIHDMLASGTPDFPFCLCWANEDWTRSWDGRSGEVLIGQNYCDEDDLKHIQYLSGIFKDSRYIRINGKPLFLVYRANRMPDPGKTAKIWRDEAKRLGIGEIYLCRVESFNDEHTDPNEIGFDASVEFQPDWQQLGKEEYIINTHKVYNYSTVVERMLRKEKPAYKRYPCVLPGWDNSPRRNTDSTIFVGSSPELFGSWLENAIKYFTPQDEKIVFVNAWNEWGEGNHLEPDEKFGKTYLETIYKVLTRTSENFEKYPLLMAANSAINKKPVLCSIVIPVFNKWDYTHRCLKSLMNLSSQINFEIIIVNNASTDETKENLEKIKDVIKVIDNKENNGFTIASNQGAAIAEGKYIVFLNNDTEPLGEWLKELVDLAERDSLVGAVGAKLIYPNGELQEAGGIIFSNAVGYNFGRGDDPDKEIYNHVAEVDYCTGACLLVRADLFRKYGGFDERYAPAYSEDSDLCFTLRKKGYKILYNPKAVIIHYESITSGKDNNSGFKRYLEINRWKFIEKWKEDLVFQDSASLGHRNPPGTYSRVRLLDSKNNNKYLYRKRYIFNGLEELTENSLAYYPTQCQLNSDVLPVNLFYNRGFLFKLVKAYGFPWLYGRAYLEGRNLFANFHAMSSKLNEELKLDLSHIKENIEVLNEKQDKTFEFINALESISDIFIDQYCLTLGDQKLAGAEALSEFYKVASRIALLEGVMDEANNIPENEAIIKIEKLIEEKYRDEKQLPAFVGARKELITQFHPVNHASNKNKKKRAKAKVLCFFPHNPYPPRTGADHGFMGMINALQELNCEIHLFSSTYFTDKLWKIKDIEKLCNDNDLHLYIHQADEEDHIHVSMMQLMGDYKKWQMKIPESLSTAFHEAYLEAKPDILLINYAWWGNIIDKADYSGVLKVLQMHDLISLNSQMQTIARRLMGKPPYNPQKINPDALIEDVFAKYKLEARDDEYEIYAKYDCVVAVSERECKGINSRSEGTKTIVIPAPIGSKKFTERNTYSNYPLFAIADNIFNMQAYCYLVSKVLPLVRKEIPDFQINVIGDACKILIPAEGVNLLGFVDDITSLYKESCFAIASMIGGTGQSVKILEAMANGLPVVSLRNSYQTSSIRHNINGFVAESAEEFAEYVIRLYKDRTLCGKLGKSAKETIRKEYSQEKLVECIRPLVDSVKSNKKQPVNVQSAVIKCEDIAKVNPEEVLKPYIEKREGNLVFISDAVFKAKEEILFSVFESLFGNLPSFYAHFGGAGDACLLLSNFYDNDPEQTVVSFANSKKMMKSFFNAFPKIKKIFLFDCPANNDIHQLLRYMLHRSGNCRSMGVTPSHDYMVEWNQNIDIFSKYGIRKNPEWAAKFSKIRLQSVQVVLQPKGSAKGMVGSKRNMLTNTQWNDLLCFWTERGIKPIVIGTPDENEIYPVNVQCINKRSYNFSEQMEIIAAGDLFIGADSWGKTFSALCGIPTIVYPSIMGDDLKGWKDPSDYIFIDPWDTIHKVSEGFVDTINSLFSGRYENHPVYKMLSNRMTKIIWEGSQFVNHSLALVNRELCRRLIGRSFDMSIIPFERDEIVPLKSDPVSKIKEYYNKKLSEVNIHVRHHWPPNLNPPAEGHWVIIQPWEFGSLPKKWVDVFSSQVDEMWVPSNYVRDLYMSSGVPGERVFVVPNGFDEEKFNPKNKPYKLSTKKKFKFLFVGGTIYRKGIDILLETYVKTFKKSDNVCLVIKDMGGESFYKGQTFSEKIAEIKKQKDAPEIEYIDKMLSDKELAGLYTACDVLVHPYRGEGFGLPILEAMASGTPAIVTKGGACLDFCDDNNSILVDAEKIYFDEKKVGELETVDQPWLYEVKVADLADKMIFAAQNPNIINGLGKKAVEFVHAYFTWDNAFEKLQARIESIISGPVLRENKVRYIGIPENKDKRFIIKRIRTGSENEVIACPFCSSTDALEYRKSADIVKCRNCNTVYLRTRMTQEKMRDFYQAFADENTYMKLPKDMGELKNSSLRREWFMEEILEMVKFRGDMLDVGCGWGAFLDYARSKGFYPRGVELTARCVDFANKELNIPVTSHQLIETEFDYNSFALVTMNHVLEHIPEPKQTLHYIYKILKPEGMFCGIVPNIESVSSTAFEDRWDWIDAKYHYVHYSPDTLRMQLEKAGFVVEKMYTAAGDFGEIIPKEILKQINPAASEDEISKRLKAAEMNGWGEEIRFFARKPLFHAQENGIDSDLHLNNTFAEETGYIKEGHNMSNMNTTEFDEYFNKAFNYYQTNQYKDSLLKLYEAENYYRADEENKINLVDLNVLRGTIYLLLEDLNNSRVSFEKALNLDPASSEACSGLGEILFRTGFVQEAKTMFEWAVQNDPDSSGAKNRLAKANRELGLRDDHSTVGGGGSEENEAQILVDEAYELFQNKQHSQALSKLLLAEDMLEEIESDSQRTELSASISNFKGFNYLAMNKLDKAKQNFEQSLSINPESSQACAGLGEIFYLSEKDQEAKTMYEWAVKNDPQNSFALNGLAKVNKALGHPEMHNSLISE